MHHSRTEGTTVKYLWLDNELLAKPGVTKDLQAEWNWIRYQLGGKMFAAVCLDDATGKPLGIQPVSHTS